MNSDLIKEIESTIHLDSEEYKNQLKLARQDFYDYCKPGAVNNWQHPEKPPTQACLALVCEILKPKRILDLGTGLTGLTFRKYSPESESILIDNDITWLLKLKKWLSINDLKNDNLFWSKDLSFLNLNNLIPEWLEYSIFASVRKLKIPAKHWNSEEPHTTDAWALEPPKRYYFYSDLTHLSNPKADPQTMSSTLMVDGYWIPRDGEETFYPISDKDKLNPESIGKFNFIHYDLGGMYVRTAYLRLAIDLLDRTADSVIYIDDLHKQDVLFEGKKYKELAEEIVSNRGGIWLDCKEELTDFQGGYGGLVYFPPIK